MKTFLIIIATAAVTIVVSSFINGAKSGYERTWLISAVKVPGSMAIEAIQSDLRAGQYDRAKAKIDAMAQTWQRFNSGPDSFRGTGIGDIMVTFSRLEITNGAAGSEPDGAANRCQPVSPQTNRPSAAAGSGR
jgi:hypothetical protein